MVTVPCNRCNFQECQVVCQKYDDSYTLSARCYGCGKYWVLSESEYAALYEKMDEIPIDDMQDTMEQRVADREGYYRAHPSAALLREGIRAGNMGHWQKALAKIEAAIRKDPYNKEAHYYRAAGYIELGDWQKTREVAEKSLEFISHDNVLRGRLLFVLADALVMLKEDSQTIFTLEQSLQYGRRDPNLDVKKIQEKLELLRGGKGDEIREDTYKDPRYEHLTSGEEKGLFGKWSYAPVGLVAGLGCSALFARLYLSKPATTNLAELLAAPPLVLILPVVVGFAIGLALQAFAKGQKRGPKVPSPLGGNQPLLMAEVSAVGLVIGGFLGASAALIIFFVAPFAGHDFLSHLLNGVLAGGGVGAIIGPISTFIEKW
jgi:tetratricopeptide (TPR) repeat protein